jgi:hypothetical protein
VDQRVGRSHAPRAALRRGYGGGGGSWPIFVVAIVLLRARSTVPQPLLSSLACATFGGVVEPLASLGRPAGLRFRRALPHVATARSYHVCVP